MRPGLLTLVLGCVIAAVGLALALRWWSGRELRPDQRLVYKQLQGHALELHLFRPLGPAGQATPALVLFHGGAWQFGSPAQFHPQCRHFSRLGMACVSVGYRIASVHGSTPADAVQDARDALRYLRRHAAALGIRPDRIVVGGGSAGGHLAAALAAPVPLPDPGADAAVSTRPDALVLYNPMLDLSPGMPDHELVVDTWQALSPQQHIGPGMPPTLVLVGDQDAEVAVGTVQAFCAAVHAVGSLCEVRVHAGAGHGFFNAHVEDGRYFQRANGEVAAFLTGLGYLAPSALHNLRQ